MNILAFSGRMQSGKNTCFNYLLGIELLKLDIVRNNIKITENGQLEVSDIFGDKSFAGIFDIDRPTKSMKEFRLNYIYPFIRNFSFADNLKQFCINILGLRHEQCYGNNSQKDSLTNLRWERLQNNNGKSGFMTAREVMENFADVLRYIDDDCWIRGCINDIQNSNTNFAIITDCRYPNEVEAIHRIGGKIIRLDRKYNNSDSPGERSLDSDVFDWSRFDKVIKNSELTIGQTNKELYRVLFEWGYIDEISE